MRAKQKQLFTFSNFRGLDKENKPLKVEPFRASDGFNFYIDSNTLKTRPAISLKKKPDFFLEEGDFLIDWYDFKGISIYITKKHIYIQDEENNILFNEETNDVSFVKGDFEPFDFEGKKPLFREEENVLFIFCLGQIFVFAFLKSEISETNEVYCLYDLQDKPSLQSALEDEIRQKYVDLPEPYIPTVFIGGQRFDDTNLLSRTKKYRLFAESTEAIREADEVIYTLPTHYEENKHGSFEYIKENYKVRFFDDLFEDFTVLPIFLGIEEEDFNSGDLSDKGEFVDGVGSESEPIEIETEFLPNQPFEYAYSGNSLERVIRENFNLQVRDFFHLKVLYSQKTVFQYIMAYLQQHSEEVEEWGDNKVIVFDMPYKANEIKYDNSTNFILERKNKIGTKKVYVQLRKFLEIPFAIDAVQSSVSSNSYLNHTPWDERSEDLTYPDFPTTFNGEEPDYIVDLGHGGREWFTDYNDREGNERSNFQNSERNKLETEAQMYAHQNRDNYSDGDVIQFTRTMESMQLWWEAFRANDGSWVHIVFERKYSFSCFVRVVVNRETINENMYSLKYREEKNAFEFAIKDFFFDYNREPSIEVEIEFEKNDDYDLIAKSTFGVNFGSENRLFLAGHPDYPNLDRYNVSNSLLGDNVKNQSYELSYFPSRNYRVVGGAGPINGYVVATDTQLYVTKEKFRNEETFYIRERRLDDNGVVNYQEFKTNINRSPLNNQCITNFFNDILMLTEEGLFAVEISSNILTNQRLQKLRSGLINQEIIESVKNEDHNNIFMVRNGQKLYIFVGQRVFVADVRFIFNDPDSMVENISYEIVDWRILKNFRSVKTEEDSLMLLSEDNMFYDFQEEKSHDETIERGFNEFFYQKDIEGYGDCFEISEEFNNKILNFHETFSSDKKAPSILFDGDITTYNYYRFGKKEHMDFEPSKNKINFKYPLLPFVDFKKGETIILLDHANREHLTTVLEVSEEKDYIIISTEFPNWFVLNELYVYLHNRNFSVNLIKWEGYHLFNITPAQVENNEEAVEAFFPTKMIIEEEEEPLSATMFFKKPIETYWVSKISDFENNVMEKTMFRVNLFAKRKEDTNEILFGYKTRNTIRDDQDFNKPLSKLQLTQPFDFNMLDFNTLGIQTFSEIGASFPMKENNFLYIQYLVFGYGQIELNGFSIIYKNNRNIKTIG